MKFIIGGNVKLSDTQTKKNSQFSHLAEGVACLCYCVIGASTNMNVRGKWRSRKMMPIHAINRLPNPASFPVLCFNFFVSQLSIISGPRALLEAMRL